MKIDYEIRKQNLGNMMMIFHNVKKRLNTNLTIKLLSNSELIYLSSKSYSSVYNIEMILVENSERRMVEKQIILYSLFCMAYNQYFLSH